MIIDDMLAESLQLLVLGMGTVFFILLLLIAGLSLMSSLVSAPVEATEPAEQAASKIVTSRVPGSSGVVAVIQAAIHSYRASPNR